MGASWARYGRQTRSFTWVGDVVDGLERLGRMDEAMDGSGPLVGSAFNFASSVETSIADLAAQISALTGASVSEGQPATWDPRRRRPEVDTVKQRLGWEASTPLEDGQRTWRASRTSGDTITCDQPWGSPSSIKAMLTQDVEAAAFVDARQHDVVHAKHDHQATASGSGNSSTIGPARLLPPDQGRVALGSVT